jgi:hypothetical protein
MKFVTSTLLLMELLVYHHAGDVVPHIRYILLLMYATAPIIPFAVNVIHHLHLYISVDAFPRLYIAVAAVSHVHLAVDVVSHLLLAVDVAPRHQPCWGSSPTLSCC